MAVPREEWKKGVTLLFGPDLFIPAAMAEAMMQRRGNVLRDRTVTAFQTAARLRPGVSMRQAEPGHSGRWVGAPVASLRCRTLPQVRSRFAADLGLYYLPARNLNRLLTHGKNRMTTGRPTF